MACKPAEAAAPRDLPALDRMLREASVQALLDEHGHTLVADCARAVLEAMRERALRGDVARAQVTLDALAGAVGEEIDRRLAPRMKAVLNLTGTVIHTNLGRALLAEAAARHVQAMMAAPNNLEYDLAEGGRGERESIVEELICTLTGAEAATVVNNNAAAVLLTVAALAHGREVIISRGELVEIGAAFRMPDVMSAAGAALVEVGTTNRTHPRDFAHAIGSQTALLMKVHTSNYCVQGFHCAVSEAELAQLAHAHGLPCATDLGSGALVDLARYALPHEPMPQESLAAGCDVVSFSGDKLLGGPQAGLIVGTRECIERIRRHPMKRALRLSKLPLAALEATLRLYLRPERLTRDLPTLRHLARPLADIEALARAVLPEVARALAPAFRAEVISTQGQIGSGSLPVARLPSAGIAITPAARTGAGRALQRLSQALRALPQPVIGRIEDARLVLDLRTLDAPAPLCAQLPELARALAQGEAA